MVDYTAQVTPDQAQATLAAVKAQFARYLRDLPKDEHPKLYPPMAYTGGWTIVWPSGWYGWAQEALRPTFDAQAYDRYRADGLDPEDAAAKARVAEHAPPAGVLVEVARFCLLRLWADSALERRSRGITRRFMEQVYTLDDANQAHAEIAATIAAAGGAR